MKERLGISAKKFDRNLGVPPCPVLTFKLFSINQRGLFKFVFKSNHQLLPWIMKFACVSVSVDNRLQTTSTMLIELLLGQKGTFQSLEINGYGNII